ncbi:MAG: low molecular weight phosphatase family protein [Geminicoccaceae bacterium]|nr:MAG: low molecular weight phosphatase family protein [Geminicoccaceae bacterium]
MRDLPGSILFACTMNVIRSPMAASIMRFFHGRRVYVDSVGVRPGEPDFFVPEVLDEIGINLKGHVPQSFDALQDDFFDVVISLSPEAHHRAVEYMRDASVEVEFWHMPDPSLARGSRQAKLDAYRALRDELMDRIYQRFPPDGSPAP